jgi:hypothetical protein
MRLRRQAALRCRRRDQWMPRRFLHRNLGVRQAPRTQHRLRTAGFRDHPADELSVLDHAFTNSHPPAAGPCDLQDKIIRPRKLQRHGVPRVSARDEALLDLSSCVVPADQIAGVVVRHAGPITQIRTAERRAPYGWHRARLIPIVANVEIDLDKQGVVARCRVAGRNWERPAPEITRADLRAGDVNTQSGGGTA